MFRACLPVVLSVLVLAAVLMLAAPALAQALTIYRCVGANGDLTLRDSPCEKGETQQAREMQRPRDPAPVPEPPLKPAQPPEQKPAAAPQPQTVYLVPPRPMYECITADGERYASDSGEGKPRWVPYWTVGYPVWSRGGGVSGNVSIGNGNLSFGGGSPTPLPPRPPHPRPPGHGVVLPAGGAWVRDECHPLPQQEVCARLADRRYEILRRYHSAMPSERRELDREQRGIDARIANDCRNYR